METRNKKGVLHSFNDKPAVIWADGSKFWFRNGKLHRDDDKPAVIWADGIKYWYRNGELHRDGDKLAMISASGTKYWYKNGVRYFPKKEKKYSELVEKLAELEHEQWMAWSKSLIEQLKVVSIRKKEEGWIKCWKPYSELSEEQKEQDREWAIKALNIFHLLKKMEGRAFLFHMSMIGQKEKSELLNISEV